jgi:hypothetical protein
MRKRMNFRRIYQIALAVSVTLTLGLSSALAQLPTYEVARMKSSPKIDANWNKKEWSKIKAVKVDNFLWNEPKFKPEVEAKMAYDKDNIYLIYQVKDQYVRSVATQINGKVWEDSAIEFFFAPDTEKPDNYFNLEINAGGTPLLHYRTSRPSADDIRQIEIATTLPKVIDPVINEPTTWTIEIRIPLAMLTKYAVVSTPAKGVSWRGNFYKIAENNGNQHFGAWSSIDAPRPNFHLPKFFGHLKFK